jgi:hypothetical protein
MDPKIAAGFSILGNALFPDPARLAQAALTRSAIAENDAQTRKITLEGDKLSTAAQNLVAFQSILKNNEAGLSDILSSGIGATDTYGTDPMKVLQLALGTLASRGVDVNNPESLSRALLGAGTVNSWADTPSGFGASEANDILMNNADNQTITAGNVLDNQTITAGNVLDNQTITAGNVLDNQTSVANNTADNVAAAARGQSSLANALTIAQEQIDAANLRHTADITSREGIAADNITSREGIAAGNNTSREGIAAGNNTSREAIAAAKNGGGGNVPLSRAQQLALQKDLDARVLELHPDRANTLDATERGLLIQLAAFEYNRTKNYPEALNAALDAIRVGKRGRLKVDLGALSMPGGGGGPAALPGAPPPAAEAPGPAPDGTIRVSPTGVKEIKRGGAWEPYSG